MNQVRNDPNSDGPVPRIENAFRTRYGEMPPVVAFAPGRVEILGNHTDYNEGFVLSAAIEEGMVFAAGPSDEPGQSCLYAADLDREVRFRTEAPAPDPASRWANYSKGMLHLLSRGTSRVTDFRAVFGGNVPMGAGLSSSAALEVSTGLALARLMNLSVPRLKMAQLAQQAEIEFSGTRCGLLDQISSLYGEAGSLVFTDFRTLEAHSAHMPDSACFLLCNTGVKHSLVDSEYNERRASCEAVAKQLAHLLNRPVRALRDVSPEEWAAVADRVESTPRLRAAHVIGENDRVLRGKAAMERGDVEEFGRCMTASHESSRHSFENSCTELDQAVEAVLPIQGVMGARLSGGGFGGSVVALVVRDRMESIREDWSRACSKLWKRKPEIRIVRPSAGARLVRQTS